MVLKKFSFLLFPIYLLLAGCGGHTNSSPPLETYSSPENDPSHLPSIPKSPHQTPNEYFLEQFFQFCEYKNKNFHYPFSLSLDFRNIRSILSPKIHQWKNLSTAEFINDFNQWAKEYGNLSHLYLSQDPNLNQTAFCSPSDLKQKNNKDSAYLYIKNFSENYSKNFIEQSMLVAHQQNKLMINLTNNNGGFQENLEHFLSFFLPSKTIYGHFIANQHLNHLSLSDYKQNWVTTHLQQIVQRLSPYWNDLTIPSHNFPIFNGKVAILINENSFSSAEIFTYTLKTLKRKKVKVFGQPSQGKVQFSLSVNIDILNTKLTYPIGEFFTPQNTSLEGTGVSVDEIAYSESESFGKALEWLKSN